MFLFLPYNILRPTIYSICIHKCLVYANIVCYIIIIYIKLVDNVIQEEGLFKILKDIIYILFFIFS